MKLGDALQGRTSPIQLPKGWKPPTPYAELVHNIMVHFNENYKDKHIWARYFYGLRPIYKHYGLSKVEGLYKDIQLYDGDAPDIKVFWSWVRKFKDQIPKQEKLI